MGRSLKIVVTGPYNAGKTRFITTLSDIDVVSTERNVTGLLAADGQRTTVAMDYGRVTLEEGVIHLNGTPGQARFDFMWDILMREMNGFIVLVDSCDESSLREGRALIDLFTAAHTVPYLVAANKQDQDCAVPIDTVRRQLGLEHDVLVMPCMANRKSSARQVLKQLVSIVSR